MNPLVTMNGSMLAGQPGRQLEGADFIIVALWLSLSLLLLLLLLLPWSLPTELLWEQFVDYAGEL